MGILAPNGRMPMLKELGKAMFPVYSHCIPPLLSYCWLYISVDYSLTIGYSTHCETKHVTNLLAAGHAPVAHLHGAKHSAMGILKPHLASKRSWTWRLPFGNLT